MYLRSTIDSPISTCIQRPTIHSSLGPNLIEPAKQINRIPHEVSDIFIPNQGPKQVPRVEAKDYRIRIVRSFFFPSNMAGQQRRRVKTSGRSLTAASTIPLVPEIGECRGRGILPVVPFPEVSETFAVAYLRRTST